MLSRLWIYPFKDRHRINCEVIVLNRLALLRTILLVVGASPSQSVTTNHRARSSYPETLVGSLSIADYRGATSECEERLNFLETTMPRPADLSLPVLHATIYHHKP